MIDFYHQQKPKRRRRLPWLILAALAAFALVSIFSGPDKTPSAGDFLSALEDSLQARDTAAAAPVQPAPAEPAAPAEPVRRQAGAATAQSGSGTLLHASVRIRNSLTASLENSPVIADLSRATGLKRLVPMLVSHLQRPLIWKIHLGRQIQKDDVCTFIFRRIPEQEMKTRDDIPDDIEILAIRYYSLLLQDTLCVYHFTPAGARFGSFYHADGTGAGPVFDAPVIREYIQITAPFNENRGYRHQGVDFKAPVGTPVYAPFSGMVSRVNWTRKNNGNCLEITLDRQPYTVKFLHLDKVAVKRQQSVKAGQIVAYSGNTGRSYAPHLHYQVNVGARGRAVDPVKFHTTHHGRIAPADLPAFRALVKRYDDLMLERQAAGSPT